MRDKVSGHGLGRAPKTQKMKSLAPQARAQRNEARNESGVIHSRIPHFTKAELTRIDTFLFREVVTSLQSGSLAALPFSAPPRLRGEI